MLRGPSGVGKSTVAKTVESWLNTMTADNNKRLWEAKVFHEQYGVAMVRFFEGRVSAINWQSICHGIHLNRSIEALDFLRGATPYKPRIVILDRSLEDVAIFTWMAAGTTDESVDTWGIIRLQHQVFKDLYQEMGSWHNEPGLKVISIGFAVSRMSLKERIKARAAEDKSRQTEAKFLLIENGGKNFSMMWQTLMTYTVNMEREFGGIYSLLKSHLKLPNIAWYKINGDQPAAAVDKTVKMILDVEMGKKNISSVKKEMSLTEPPIFTEKNTDYQNIQRPPESLRETDLLKYYSKGHRLTL